MRSLLALLMLAALTLAGSSPGCARPPAMHHGMTHHGAPGPCDQRVMAHDCIGCGVELPEPPHIRASAFIAPALPPIARRMVTPAGTTPHLPLPPPRIPA